MMKITPSSGVVHAVPKDIVVALASSAVMREAWEDITPLARNEWLCWVGSAKKDETRVRRIRIMKEKLLAGGRRPCCWAGCTHRG